jgi:ABC-type transporter Mla subunit MlaD
MSSAALVLFQHAEFIRNSAERTRRLAHEATVPEVAEQLRRVAADLDQRALQLEARAASIAKTVAKTQKLSGEIRRLVADAGERSKGLRRKLN